MFDISLAQLVDDSPVPTLAINTDLLVDGTIGVPTEMGQGTRFRVKIPVTQPAATAE